MQPTTTGRPVPPERNYLQPEWQKLEVVYGGYDTKTQPAMPANMESPTVVNASS